MILQPSQIFLFFLKKTGLFLLVMTLCRVLFLLINLNYFSNPGWSEFLQGIRFDLVAIFWVLLPMYLLMLFPFKPIKKIMKWKSTNVFYVLMVGFFILGNCIDVIYYKFILKRSTWDVLTFVSTGDDVSSLIPRFLMDYWYMLALGFTLFFLFIWANSFIRLNAEAKEKKRTQWIYSAVILGLMILFARGGVQLKPLNIIDASRYTSAQNVPLLINTPFSMLKTMNADVIQPKTYLSTDAAKQLFNPEWINLSDSANRKNVVIIILESFSKEYIGFYHGGKGFTPFLDSLMNHSLVFENAFANGKKSIEALPAIFSGLPNLMNASYNNSAYAGNHLSSIANELKALGYVSSFFHGGKNGTMGFDSYTRFTGFDQYYGKDEYDNDADFDGSWGIYDVPYFQYFAQQQKAMREPFLSSIFSLSAHHPYKLPESYREYCPTGQLPIHPTICYSDFALRKYFETIQKETWYQNSIFIITADHTAQNVDPLYGTSKGIYAIPFILFDPSQTRAKIIEKVTQQADIVPTVFDYLHLPANMVLFGQSALDSTSKGFAINYLNNIYQFIEKDYTLLFDGEQLISVFDNQNDPLFENNLAQNPNEAIQTAEMKCKAVIQQYSQRLIENRLTPDE